MSRQSGQQALLIAASLSLWSAAGHASLLALLAAYVGVWLSWQWRPVRGTIATLRPKQLFALAGLLALPGLAFGFRMRSRIAEHEAWPTLSARVLDRLRIEALPAIAPGLVSADQPQTFYVRAPHARAVRVRLGIKGRELVATGLGHDLFRLSFDPKRDGPLEPADGELVVQISTDQERVERRLRVVTPLVHPRWFCASPLATVAAAPSEETDELAVIDQHGRLTRVAVTDGPADCVFASERVVVVSHRFDGRLSAYDVATGQLVGSVQLPGALGRIALDPQSSRLAVASAGRTPSLLIVDWPLFTLRETVPLPAAADWLAFGRDASTLVVATRSDASLHVLREESGRYVVAASQRLGRPAVTLARARDGGRVWIATTDYRPDGRVQLGNHFVQDQLLTFELATLRLLERRVTARRSDRQSKPGDVDQGGSPLGITELRDGSLAVAFAGTDEVWRMRPAAVDPEVIDLSQTELHAPHGLAELQDGTLVVSSPSSAAFGLVRPASPRVAVVALGARDELLRKQQPAAYARRLGERGFYESTRAGIACQSCHLHADADASSYNLGDHRAIPTLSVRGLIGTAPYLRDGSYPRLRDLDSVAEDLYRGYLRKQPGRALLLETYLESLPRLQPLAAASELAAQRRGHAVFVKAQCGRCHPPPAFTNLAALPMTALFPTHAAALPAGEMLDVPSLLSVSRSAPYLNDGRAASLRAVLRDENPDNLHGATRALAEVELRDLVTFLESL